MIRWRGRARRRLDTLAAPGAPVGYRPGDLLDRYPRTVVVLAALLAGSAVAVPGGPVAAGCLAAYAAATTALLVRRRAAARAARDWAAALDAVQALAGDLRAGVPGASALAAALPGLSGTDPSARAVADQVAAAMGVADLTGAPLADLLARVEDDARTRHRLREQARAQAAGAMATAWLLAALPLAGVALGYGLGADPLWTLLRTRLGAACAVGAVALQFAGLYWSARLSRRVYEAAR